MCHPRWSVRALGSVFGTPVGLAYFPTIRGFKRPGVQRLTGDPLLFRTILCVWSLCEKKSKGMNRVTVVAIVNSAPNSNSSISGEPQGLLESEHVVTWRAGNGASSMAANFTPGLGDVRKEKQQQTSRGSHREMPFILRQGREHKSHLPKSKVTPPCLSLTFLLSLHCCGVL